MQIRRRENQPLVVGDLLAHRLHLLGAQEAAATLAPPGVAELVVGAMLARIFGGFAVAAGGTTDIVLLTDTARVQSSQGEQLLLELGDAALNLEGGHTDSYMMAIGYCQQKNERETNHEPQKKSLQPSFLLPLRSSFGHGGSRCHLACLTCLLPLRLGRQSAAKNCLRAFQADA